MTSTQTVCDLRIVLLGKTGSGKSATGNTILSRKAFEVVDFIKSANKLCEKQKAVVEGKTISIIDTPGLFNTAVTKQQLKTEIQKCIFMSFPGPHVFLLVLKLGVRFTKEERDTVKWIQENFGDEALCRTIILFTHADQLKGKPLDEYIRKSDHLQELVNSCGGRYHSFNNEDRNNQDQVTELLKKIDAMMEKNEMSHYTIEMFKTTQKKKEGKKVIIAYGIAGIVVLGIVILGKGKVTRKIATIISGRAAGEIAVATTGEAAVESIKTLKTAGEKVAKEAVTAVQKAVAAAGKEIAEKAAATIEKSIVTAGEAITKKSVATVEKAIGTAGEAAANKAVAVIEAAAGKAVQTAAEIAVETAGGAVQTAAAGTGVAAQGAVTGLAAAAAAGAARAAAAAGKVATSGRIAAVVAAAAAVGGAAVTLLSVLKP